MSLLAWTIYLSFLGAVVLIALPRINSRAARIIALLTAFAGLICTLGTAFEAKIGELQTVTRIPWIPSLGIEYYLAADGISWTLVLLTGLAAIAGILFSWNVEHRANEFFAFYLALIGGVYGVFLSFDLFLLFVFYEIAIIPKYFIIAIWGSTRREYGAMKLALYSFVGSAMVLVGIVAAFVLAGGKSMSLMELAKFSFPHSFQMWAFPLVFIGFAILAGLWPFHTWAPTGHVAAPTAASMLLAGVVMKLGAYGCLRVAMSLFPQGMDAWQVDPHVPWSLSYLTDHSISDCLQRALYSVGLSSWRDIFSGLAVIGIVYGAMVALVQNDFKFVIGYSSVSHMGFVLLGLMALNQIGLSGAVLQMFSHGVIAGLLFAVVGRMVYERTHTRELAALQEMDLAKAMPFAAVIFTIASMASMGLPGFSGFVAELQILIGAWQVYPTLTVLTGAGILVGVAYTLRALQQAFFAEPDHATEPVASNSQPHAEFGPISVPERLGALLLVGSSLVIGLYPRLLLDLIVPSFSGAIFDGLHRSGGL
jgi:NADH-quinone oxidoreductase subunit M